MKKKRYNNTRTEILEGKSDATSANRKKWGKDFSDSKILRTSKCPKAIQKRKHDKKYFSSGIASEHKQSMGVHKHWLWNYRILFRLEMRYWMYFIVVQLNCARCYEVLCEYIQPLLNIVKKKKSKKGKTARTKGKCGFSCVKITIYRYTYTKHGVAMCTNIPE